MVSLGFHATCLALLLFFVTGSAAHAQTLRVSFDDGTTADIAAGRGEPWSSKNVELVPGKFGRAAQVQPGGEIVFAGERNLQAGRGTLAVWVRVPELPGPHDIERLVFVQSKERGYWTYLASLEWQESVFRAKVFDFYHGHGFHDPQGLPAFQPDRWHHVALVWDQSRGVRFYLDGRPVGSTWGRQAWWHRPTPHAIHLSWPGATYDELVVYDAALDDDQVAALARDNRWQVDVPAAPLSEADRERLADSLGIVGRDHLLVVEATAVENGPATVIRQARVRQALDDRIPSWKVLDGRRNLFWPEWRAPYVGDVDFSGSEIGIEFEPGQKLSHLIVQGLSGDCRVFGERSGYVSREPILEVPPGLHFVAATALPEGLTGLRVPRREGMKLHEVGAYAVMEQAARAANQPSGSRQDADGHGIEITPITGPIDLDELGELADWVRTRTLPEERRVLGSAGTNTPPRSPEPQRQSVAGLGRMHLVTDPATTTVPLDALGLRVRFVADWSDDLWWVRVQDPVNPRRDLIHLPVRVRNPSPGKQATLTLELDFWDIMLDEGSRLWVELLPGRAVELVTDGEATALTLLPGDPEKVLAEFAHTQSQLAFSYWQLGSEANGTKGADPDNPGFALLGSITHNYEFKRTLEWVRRHIADHGPTNNLWRITFGRRDPVEVDLKPRLAPEGAPEWAVWGRELLERFRTMAHFWADWQGPDGQLGGGWNDDPCFPGVFISLPLLGDTKTQTMFRRVFDGVERTGWMHNSVSRSPIDARHATDLIAWRAHMVLFDYGEPRHIERALDLTRELHRWTAVNKQGHRRFLSGYFSEDGPAFAPKTIVRSGGTTGRSGAGDDSAGAREFLRDPLFAAWYSQNPGLVKFLREIAEGDYHNIVNETGGGSHSYLLLSYATVFGDPKFIDAPLDRLARGRGVAPMWTRLMTRFTDGERHAELHNPRSLEAVLVSRDPAPVVAQLEAACRTLAEGWQFRGGEAGGANDHFSVPGQEALSQLYLGTAMSWLRPVAGVIPPIAVSWDHLDDQVAAFVHDASPRKLRVAVYNFGTEPRTVGMRVWELAPGRYELREGVAGKSSLRKGDRHPSGKESPPSSQGSREPVPFSQQEFEFDGRPSVRKVDLRRASRLELTLPPQQVQIIELEQLESRPVPKHLPDLAVGEGDIFYDKATDRLKVVVHNIGAAAAENVTVRFEDPDGHLLLDRTIEKLDAPLDLVPKKTVVGMPQPTLHRVSHITVRIDPDQQIDEITQENNVITWTR